MDSSSSSTSTSSVWTEAIEDLLDGDDVDGAISLLDSVVSRLQTTDNDDSHLRLAAALTDLADLHSSRGHSLMADHLRSRALVARSRAARPELLRNSEPKVDNESAKEETKTSILNEDDDDWEAIVDREALDIGLTISPAHESLESRRPPETNPESPKRRGRGSFMYKKDGLYSDEQFARKDTGDSVLEKDFFCKHVRESDINPKTRNFGTQHVLVLYDFSPSMRTTDLEKYFGKFQNSEVAIRWVNDTCALAVFRTPDSANEAQCSLRFPFKVRRMDENDALFSQVSDKELEPPLPRPKTSARTANRMIAQVMGLKPSSGFGANELKKQEQARKDRIRARQVLRNDAWGPDDP